MFGFLPDAWASSDPIEEQAKKRLTARRDHLAALLNDEKPALTAGLLVQLQLKGDSPPDPTSASIESQDIANAVSYRLAVTDIFVENAISSVEKRAHWYAISGSLLYFIGLLILISGVVLADSRLIPFMPKFLSEFIEIDQKSTFFAAPQDSNDLAWRILLTVSAFSLMALTSISTFKGAKACFDQRERLFARRHSLRQGRLFIHLSGGRVTNEEFQKAFDWNHISPNAFGDFSADLQAPWSKPIEEVVKTIPELVKAVSTASSGSKPSSKP